MYACTATVPDYTFCRENIIFLFLLLNLLTLSFGHKKLKIQKRFLSLAPSLFDLVDIQINRIFSFDIIWTFARRAQRSLLGRYVRNQIYDRNITNEKETFNSARVKNINVKRDL